MNAGTRILARQLSAMLAALATVGGCATLEPLKHICMAPIRAAWSWCVAHTHGTPTRTRHENHQILTRYKSPSRSSQFRGAKIIEDFAPPFRPMLTDKSVTSPSFF
jgi:hypothetical protein